MRVYRMPLAFATQTDINICRIHERCLETRAFESAPTRSNRATFSDQNQRCVFEMLHLK